jgi:NADPH:quinone reductase-like Zn-dependent oxidoreductase
MSTMGVIRGISVGSRADLVALLAFMNGRFDPIIDRVFGFNEAAKAFAYLATRKHVGKIVIRL